MAISHNLHKRMLSLPTTTIKSFPDPIVADFAILIEMHQDKDGAVDTFRHSFIRGECAPIKVHFDPAGLVLVDDGGSVVGLNERGQHFMTIDSWSRFVMNFIMETGVSPITNGTMPTRLLRDARKGYNHLQSFRQIVNHQYGTHARAGTLVKP